MSKSENKKSAPPKTPVASKAGNATGQIGPTPRPWYLTPRDTPNETRENFVQSLCIESESGFVFRISDLGHARTEPQRRVDAEFVIRAVNSFDELLAAAKKTMAFINDLSKSNPGFLSKLVLQDYAQWNEAMMELPAAIANAEGRAS